MSQALRPAQRVAALVGIGGMAMALGLLLYVADRGSTHAVLIPRVDMLSGHRLFGTLGDSLGSFVHAFAFSLFTAAAWPPRPVPAYGACAAWCAVNVAFELGQHPQVSARLAQALSAGLGQTTPTRALANYFVRGTFDGADIAAAIVGALAAACVLHFLHDGRQARHAR